MIKAFFSYKHATKALIEFVIKIAFVVVTRGKKKKEKNLSFFFWFVVLLCTSIKHFDIIFVKWGSFQSKMVLSDVLCVIYVYMCVFFFVYYFSLTKYFSLINCNVSVKLLPRAIYNILYMHHIRFFF